MKVLVSNIREELDRLECGPQSGQFGIGVADLCEGMVKLYNSQASGRYKAEKLYDLLEDLTYAYPDLESKEAVWAYISSALS